LPEGAKMGGGAQGYTKGLVNNPENRSGRAKKTAIMDLGPIKAT